LSLDDIVRMREWMAPDELAQHLASADIYAACPEIDATSVSLLEAMAAGCYPIVTNLAANREWIKNGENGALFPVGDEGALAQAIITAADNLPQLERARSLNSDIIRRRALWRNNMSQVDDIIADILTRKR
jgi:glycosyltransferase involved in cell wall biosynthesis